MSAVETIEAPRRESWFSALRFYVRRYPLGAAGAVIVALFVLMAIFAPVLWTSQANAIDGLWLGYQEVCLTNPPPTNRSRGWSVLLDGTPVLSCLVLGLACTEHSVRTVEAMADGGKLHPLQETFADLGAAQCGYCTPAFLLTAEALLTENPKPTRDEIKDALAGNLCRCTGYINIVKAVKQSAKALAKK